jgi:hypothetical protein
MVKSTSFLVVWAKAAIFKESSNPKTNCFIFILFKLRFVGKFKFMMDLFCCVPHCLAKTPRIYCCLEC